MSETKYPTVLAAATVPPQAIKTNYPAPFAARVAGRDKRRLGEAFGLKNFGVNLTRLAPGAVSALRHSHAKQDELIYIIEGEPALITDAGETAMRPGDCAGFRAGSGDAHHLVNRGDRDVLYLEIGDRTPGDGVIYPDDDLDMTVIDGKMRFVRKDGTPY
ncbi:MAG TPA: cupin domain-containing protein [Stellaceae bacterium]